MSGRLWLAAGLLILGTLAGCAHTTPPSLDHPGSAAVQQKRAIRYDPYADPNLGNDVSTIRPREYQNPAAEATQSRWHLDPATNDTRWGTTGRD
jgi:hypothetical protein